MMEETTPDLKTNTAFTALLFLFIGIAIYLSQVYLYYPFTVDDAFISFRYADNLASGHGLVFNPGERVEGFTNLLFVLLEAGAIRMGMGPETFVKILSIFAGLIIIFLTFHFNSLCRQGSNKNVLASLMLAGTGSFALAAVNGLETMVFSLCLVLSLILISRGVRKKGHYPYSAALLLGVTTWLRPEGFLCFFIFVFYLLIRRDLLRNHLRQHLLWIGLFLLTTLPLLCWRYAYYGFPVPNTFYARMPSGVHPDILLEGIKYSVKFLLRSGIVLPLLLLLSLRTLRGSRIPVSITLSAWFLICFTVYIIYSGGDWIPFDRFFIPLLPPLFILATAGFQAMKGRLRRTFIACIILFFAFSLFASCYNLSYILMRAKGYEYAHACIGRWLHSHADEGDTAAMMDVGMVGFLSGTRILDLSGLTDRKIAFDRYHHRTFDLDDFFNREPEYVVLISGNSRGVPQEGNAWPVNDRILRDSRLKERYELLFYRNHYRYASDEALYWKVKNLVQRLSPASLVHDRTRDYYLLVYRRKG